MINNGLIIIRLNKGDLWGMVIWMIIRIVMGNFDIEFYVFEILIYLWWLVNYVVL